MRKVTLTLLPLTLFVATTLHAQSTAQLDTIDVVSDNYSPQTENINGKGTVKVRQATKMSDVLRGVPGVNVNGARSVVERYNIRGVTEEFLNVTVDGARQNGFAFHHGGNYAIDPEVLKRVDIDVGSNSVATGAGSLGGSIKFETVEAADMLEDGQNAGGKVKYGWGSNGNSHQSMAMLYGRANNLDLLGYFNYRHQLDGKDGNGTKNANKGHAQDYLIKAKYNITEDQWVKISAERYSNSAFACAKANMAMCLETSPTNEAKQYAKLLRKTYTLGYGINPTDNPWVNFKANVYSTETETTVMGNPKTNIKTVGGTLSNTSETDLSFTHHRILVGGEYYKTTEKALGSTVNNYEVKLDSTSAYIEDQIGIGDFTIIPGVRYDHYRADLSETVDKSYHRFSKALGLRYALTENLVIFGNYTELFKGPDAGDLVVRSGARNYHASIEATKGENHEAGFNFATANLFTGDDDLSFTAKYFHTHYDNISRTVKIAGRSAYGNLGPVTLKGVEASVKYRIENLTASLSYARARSKQNTNIGSMANPPVAGYAAFDDTGDRYSFGLNYYLPEQQIELGWNTLWVRGINLYDELSTGRGPSARYYPGYTYKEAYSVSNAYISWAPKQVKGLELTFGVDNIFNKAYVDQSTQYYGAVDLDPGRNYKLSISYKF
ncbi:TonB-dependent receptor domain-containing protein [Mannheimia massilioguelmaensis]|uniref:TonB-dependent receptor domain-containing protein n=1 Tax=Mannheimia massilioguelmaensis TaxID=1604354 RepID=UPI0005C9B64B|nr:TonB-dependent receptor [Mannheimia massilioguelmaensis]